MSTYTLFQGQMPLLVSLPHDGTELPDSLCARLTDAAQSLPDTDWHVSRLYGFVRQLGASLLIPRFSRYLIDLNRPPDNASLYAQHNTTGLCPLLRFDGGPVYRAGQAPDADEIAERVATYWQPYHRALSEELQRLRAQHARVLLWDGHSIRGECPYLFAGVLPDFNIGTAGGASCAPAVTAQIRSRLAAQSRYSWVLDGRFQGGYITRHYGRPEAGIDAVQLELAQRTYMDETSFAYEERKAARVQALIRALLQAALRCHREGD